MKEVTNIIDEALGVIDPVEKELSIASSKTVVPRPSDNLEDLDADYKYQEHAPLIEQLQTLKSRGAELHVCPVCMKDLKITADEIMEDAFVTDKPRLFEKLGGDTMVFTY